MRAQSRSHSALHSALTISTLLAESLISLRASPYARMEADVSEVSERYGRLAGAFADKIAAVPDDAWSNPSPCPGWTARDVVGHVVSTQGMFLGFVNRELGEIPSVEDDPLGAWRAASAVIES